MSSATDILRAVLAGLPEEGTAADRAARAALAGALIALEQEQAS